jgi:hypothetical protein
MDDYIPKPMDQDRLAGLLATVQARVARQGKVATGSK